MDTTEYGELTEFDKLLEESYVDTYMTANLFFQKRILMLLHFLLDMVMDVTPHFGAMMRQENYAV